MSTHTDKLTIEHLTELIGTEEPDPTMPFGDWLVRRGLINRGQLFSALNLSFCNGFRVGDALVVMRALTRNEVEEEARRHRSFRSFTSLL
ncbi:MAG: hypothetical protein JRI55_36215 [Deltaproteobacteria bacterium]|jgi:hypothetical protein|nr:hypothetical protein [Deltaproteobacteria bacterium]